MIRAPNRRNTHKRHAFAGFGVHPHPNIQAYSHNTIAHRCRLVHGDAPRAAALETCTVTCASGFTTIGNQAR